MPLKVGAYLPNFVQDSTIGEFNLYQWLGNDWGLLLTHPEDLFEFPVSRVNPISQLNQSFKNLGVQLLGVSRQPFFSILSYLDTRRGSFVIPIIAEKNGYVSSLLEIQEARDRQLRHAFLVDSDKKIRASVTFSQHTKNNFSQLRHLVDGLKNYQQQSIGAGPIFKKGQQNNYCYA